MHGLVLPSAATSVGFKVADGDISVYPQSSTVDIVYWYSQSMTAFNSYARNAHRKPRATNSAQVWPLTTSRQLCPAAFRGTVPLEV